MRIWKTIIKNGQIIDVAIMLPLPVGGRRGRHNIGGPMPIYISRLQTILDDVNEASTLDGFILWNHFGRSHFRSYFLPSCEQQC